jgi:hypothetical protein
MFAVNRHPVFKAYLCNSSNAKEMRCYGTDCPELFNYVRESSNRIVSDWNDNTKNKFGQVKRTGRGLSYNGKVLASLKSGWLLGVILSACRLYNLEDEGSVS